MSLENLGPDCIRGATVHGCPAKPRPRLRATGIHRAARSRHLQSSGSGRSFVSGKNARATSPSKNTQLM